MKTAEALKIAETVAAKFRAAQAHKLAAAKRLRYRSAPIMRGICINEATGYGMNAEALDQLRSDHALLRSELTKVRGMLAYVLDGLRADRVDLDGGNKDVRHMKQQLKVAAHILKVTKP